MFAGTCLLAVRNQPWNSKYTVQKKCHEQIFFESVLNFYNAESPMSFKKVHLHIKISQIVSEVNKFLIVIHSL